MWLPPQRRAMDLRHRWVIARQDGHGEWSFFAGHGAWAPGFQDAVVFHSLWGAEEANRHHLAGTGAVLDAAGVAAFALSGPAAEGRDKGLAARSAETGRTHGEEVSGGTTAAP